MPTVFEDNDDFLEAFLAEEGASAVEGEEESARLWAPGREVGEWRVTGFLARGGSAEVYCATHRRLGTPAALKVLWREEEGPRERFDRETRFLMGNPGPSFPAFYGAGEEEGRPWVAMELLDECPMPSSDLGVARYLEDVGGAVAALHARGWLHRDLKPRNILRRAADGRAVLADFGLLKAIGTNETRVDRVSPSVVGGREVGVGTPGYAAPEQFAGGGATPAADVYALGMLAEECFAGNPPRAWEKIVRRATAALPRQRYPDVPSLLRAVRHRHRTRHWTLALLAVLLVAAAVGMAAAIRLRAGRGKDRPREVGQATETAQPTEAGETPVDESPQLEEVAPTPEAAVERAETDEEKAVVEEIIGNMVPMIDPKAFNAGNGAIVDPSRCISVYEVTQKQWEALMEVNPSKFRGPDLPVDNLTLVECMQFIARLNRLPSVRAAGLAFRLPTMAEWDANAGVITTVRVPITTVQEAFASASESLSASLERNLKLGWFRYNAGGTTHPVGQMPPTGVGLFDAFGNVAEPVSPPVPKWVDSGDTAEDVSRGVFGRYSCMGGSILENRACSDQQRFIGDAFEKVPDEAIPFFREWIVVPPYDECLAPDDPRRLGSNGETMGLRLAADFTGSPPAPPSPH